MTSGVAPPRALSSSSRNMDAQLGSCLFVRLFRARRAGVSGRLEINVIRAPNYAIPLSPWWTAIDF